jgi:hypothetical protein
MKKITLSGSQKLCLGLVGVMVLGVTYGALEKRSYDNKIIALNNVIADKDHTIQINTGLYEKGTTESKKLESLLDTKDQQLSELKKQLDKTNEDLVTATNLAVKWKQDYEAKGSGTETPDGKDDAGNIREKVVFAKDFGTMSVSGYTITHPPEYGIDLHQEQPLKITVAISQDKLKVWHSYATSSDPNVSAEILVSDVNPFYDEKHWYERLSLTGTMAASAGGALAGVGMGLDVNQFTVSAMVYEHTSSLAAPMPGLSVTWRPFMR